MTTINWTAGNGAEIEITVEAAYGVALNGNRKTTGRKQVEIVATMDGKRVMHDGLHTTSHPVAVAKIGNIGLTQANYDRVKAAVAAVEAEIADHNADLDQHLETLDAIDDAGRKIARQMRCGE